MSLKYFFDTEFIENGVTIELISISIVCEDGRELYLINNECDLSKANDWVKENVIAQLPPSTKVNDPLWTHRLNIQRAVSNFYLARTSVEFFGTYLADARNNSTRHFENLNLRISTL